MRKTPLKRKSWMKRGSGIKRRSPQEDGKPPPYHRFIRKQPFSQLKKRKPMAKKSSKRKVDEVEYRRLSKEFLSRHAKCQGCAYEFALGNQNHINPSTEIQHRALRGKFYLRTDTWAAVCREHGERCTVDNPWAYESGLRLTREQIRLLPDAQK